jgi:nucleoid DNA-binding protein
MKEKTMPRKATAKKAMKKTAARKKPASARTVTAVRKTKKAAPRKAAAKKSTAKKVTAKKAVPAAPIRKLPPFVTDAFSKSQILNAISEATGVSRKEVTSVLECLSELIECHVKKRGAGQFTLPGLLKIVTTRKPATKARKGINPFTGEETVFKAKPARTVVKIRPLKKLKDMVA